nr:MAG TPA: hypothetical protein [Caudoviricetes sp.]
MIPISRKRVYNWYCGMIARTFSLSVFSFLPAFPRGGNTGDNHGATGRDRVRIPEAPPKILIAERLDCAGKSNARLRRRPVFRQFKPTPADCLPPGGSLFLYRYKF